MRQVFRSSDNQNETTEHQVIHKKMEDYIYM